MISGHVNISCPKEYMSNFDPSAKPSIAIICPWLGLDNVVGIFFREQAEIARVFCDPILIRLQAQSRWETLRFFGRPICEQSISKEGLEVWTLRVPSFFSGRNRFRNKFYVGVHQWQLRRTAKRFYRTLAGSGRKVEKIHCHSILIADTAFQFSRVFGVPFILTEHNQCGLAGWSERQIKILKTAVQQASAVTACSRDKIRQFAASRIFFPITSVGNLISRYFYPPEKKEPSECLQLVTIGAFSPYKDHSTMLRALEIVARQLPKRLIQFTWIGCNGWFNGDQSNSAKELISQFDLGHIQTKLIPLASRQEISDILRNSDLFIFSSINEGMPVSVLEALACGLPVVTTNCGGVDEVIEPSNGLIVPVADHDRLANAIVSVADRLDQYSPHEISQPIRQRYGPEAYGRILRELYSIN